MTLSSRLSSDAVVTLIGSSGEPYVTVYVRAGDNAMINDIAEGEYRLLYREGDAWAGEDFARPGGTFRLNAPVRFEDSYIVVHGSTGPTTRRVPGEPWTVVLP
jgi:hypothetical protein